MEGLKQYNRGINLKGPITKNAVTAAGSRLEFELMTIRNVIRQLTDGLIR
jgi:hypothetical protein